MFTAEAQKNLKDAKEYFRKHLTQGDYHSEHQKVTSQWFGKGVERLGLDPDKPVTAEQFERLCDNRHPITGEQLTVRRRVKNHRIYHDLTVGPPKSVSVMARILGDQRIITAHDESGKEAMLEVEKVAQTRVRLNGQQGQRTTGEIVAAAFRHDTSRALDPQLHTHFVVFNATWDPVEKRWKALETAEMFELMNYFTEVYRNALAMRLRALGYSLRPTSNGFEIEGVSQSIIERFSKRRKTILAAEPGAIAAINKSRLEQLKKAVRDSVGQPPESRTKAEQALRDFTPITKLGNNARATLAHTTRQWKDNSIDPEEVLTYQRSQLSAAELEELQKLVNLNPPPVVNEAITAAQAINYAREHLFERHSVVSSTDVLEEALAFSRGRLHLKDLQAEIVKSDEFIAVGKTLTTRETLEQEKRMIELTNYGLGNSLPLNPNFMVKPGHTDEQRKALKFILESTDQVVALRGGAGTGKTTLLLELIRGIEERHEVIVLAPRTSAVQELRAKGYTRAATVQRYLQDESFQNTTKDSVLVIDEAQNLAPQVLEQVRMISNLETEQDKLIQIILAGQPELDDVLGRHDLRQLSQRITVRCRLTAMGLLSRREMLSLLELTHSRSGRMILSGDTRQHTGIEAGDALRLLEQYSALSSTGVSKIIRQTNLEYRKAIEELAKGDGMKALNRLEKLGAVEEVEGLERYRRLADEYVASVKAGKSALVVSPTWREIEEVTLQIREKWKAAGILSRQDKTLTVHDGLKWTLAQKKDFRNFSPGMILSFYRGTKGFEKGTNAEVIKVTRNGVSVKTARGEPLQITKKQAGCFEVMEKKKLEVAVGDLLLLQASLKSQRLFNGQIVTVKSLKTDGRIVLSDDRVIPTSFKTFTHGYCVTSQGSQGRTVDDVFVAMDSQSIQSASRNQFYVSTSRGREKIKIFTDDLEFLRAMVNRPGARLSATELLESTRLGVKKSAGNQAAVQTGVGI